VVLVKWLAVFVAVLALGVAFIFWINDRRDDQERECAEKGGVMVSDYPDGRICIEARRIPLD
jgi:hypothetical protein